MCEFWTAHGEGQKWYLQMKNYADEFTHQGLSLADKKIARRGRPARPDDCLALHLRRLI
jgi:hypothetical protein